MTRFAITYETRGLVIEATATVAGNYDGPSKPEAMIRRALAQAVDEGHQGLFRFTQLPDMATPQGPYIEPGQRPDGTFPVTCEPPG